MEPEEQSSEKHLKKSLVFLTFDKGRGHFVPIFGKIRRCPSVFCLLAVSSTFVFKLDEAHHKRRRSPLGNAQKERKQRARRWQAELYSDCAGRAVSEYPHVARGVQCGVQRPCTPALVSSQPPQLHPLSLARSAACARRGRFCRQASACQCSGCSYRLRTQSL